MFPQDNKTHQANDFFMDRSGALASTRRHSVGWDVRLDFDEYPSKFSARPVFGKGNTHPFRPIQAHQVRIASRTDSAWQETVCRSL